MSDSRDYFIVKGAKENNLKSVDVDIPKNKLVVMTGLSGSGKSSLAFDTLYREGQRRYLESLNVYARQLMGGYEKPDVESIAGLCPAISIDQKTTNNNPRSTVGTITEIYDFYRLLYARIGIPHDLKTGKELKKYTILDMLNEFNKIPEGTKVLVLSPVFADEKIENISKDLKAFFNQGYVRALINDVVYELDTFKEQDIKERNVSVSIVVDRLVVKPNQEKQVYQSIENAVKLSNGTCAFYIDKENKTTLSQYYSGDFVFLRKKELDSSMFSFNSPVGTCKYCKGLGYLKMMSERLSIIPNMSLYNGAIKPLKAIYSSITGEGYMKIFADNKIDVKVNFDTYPKHIRDFILYGIEYPGVKKPEDFDGIFNYYNERYFNSPSDNVRLFLEPYMYSDYCPHCHGSRLSEVILSIKIGGLNIYELSCLQISDTITYFKNLVLDSQRAAIARQAVEEIISRLEFLRNVGLGYLSLNRSASSLSGGEFQRIRLATQIGSKLSGVLYVLDEPSIGLHQRDNQKLINSLKEMRDIGNSLIVVEHDLDMMKQSDYIIDIGPGAGESGGRIVALGTPEELMNNEDSLTGKYLSGKLEVPMPAERRPWTKSIKIVGASENNLKNIDVDIPLGVFVCVTGVSGSGKSTLVNEILLKTIRNNTSVFKERAGKCTTIENYEEIEKIIEVSQDPIGRTPRSNPATYTGVFDRIRDLYSSLLESKESGYTKSNFSFNVFGGRCESCQGDGLKKISMAFLPDVYVPCEVCNGARYNKETLKVFYKGKNISDVLNMTVNEAVEFFENQPSILPKIKLLKEVGLDYIKLGQNSVTLSGGEAQRVKLATELSKRIQPTSMYILDEPTTGLHSEDIRKLLVILHKIVDEKASIVVIEHNMDVIKNADYIIDLGPEGGEAGGQLIAYGTPEEIVKNENSFTGQYLKEIIK